MAVESSQPTQRQVSGGPRAGFWRRFGALFIDGILISIVASILAAIFGINTFDYTGSDLGPYNALNLIIGWAYGTYLEGSGSGQTVGKKLLNIRVVDFDTGGRLTYGNAFLRQIMKSVSGLVFGLGFLWMLWDAEKQTWHDKVAKTAVVPTDAFPVSDWPG